ncbi:MAG: type II toxin-antitoxin system VapC family toxin [Casimicrobiaceae bacterium]
MIVVDASALIDVLLGTRAGKQVSARILVPGESIHAPHLIDLEVAQVLRRYVRTREISAQRGHAAMQDLAALALVRYPHQLFMSRIWFLRDNLTAYDAAYVVLAEALATTLLTCDRRMASIASRWVQVETL